MSIISFPYVSIGGDRKRTATDLAEAMDALATSGVSADDGYLECTKEADSLQISVSAGKGFIMGHPMSSSEEMNLSEPLDPGDVSYARHDIIVYEHNDNSDQRKGRFTHVKGTPAATPADPELTQTSTIWQVPLCRVIVPAGAQNLNSAILEDMREFSYGRHKHKTADIDDKAVTTAKIDDEAVTTAKISDCAVGTTKIANEAVTTVKIDNAAVTTFKINDGAVTAAKIASNAVDSSKIAPNAVGSSEIAANAVDSSKIATNAVGSSEIAANAVGSSEIAANAVGTSELGTINSMTLASGDTLTWSGNTLWLNVNGCTSVQLVPIVFGTSQNPPGGTYPKGTLYLTHEA